MKEISFQRDILPLKNQLYRLAQRITLDSQEAEDVVQDTMIKVWNRRESWGEIENIEAFCLTICRNLALDRTRRAAFVSPPLDEENLDTRPATTRSPEEAAEQRDTISVVRRLINNLPEKQRSCMQLRDIEGKSYKEIAEVLGITEDQVKVSIFRARQAIRQQFKKTDNYGL